MPIAFPSENPQKIAVFVATSGHSGVDRAMQHLLPALAGRGYQVDLLKVRKHGPNLGTIPAGVRVIDLGTSHVYPALPAVVRYLRRERPGVMLSDKDRVNRTALLARKLAGVPTRIILSSGTTISVDLAGRGAFERWLQRTSMGRLYGCADNVIVTSRGVADDMSAYTGLQRELINVVASPVVGAELFTAAQPRPEHPWFAPGAPPVILGVGKLAPGKGYSNLIRAFARLRREQPCRLLILGKGKQRDELLALAASLGVAKDIELPGFVADPYPYMAYASLFVHTSLLEGLGFVIIEALAVGTPVVATDCPSGPREILQDGLYGPLVPVDDDVQLAAAMRATLAHPLPKETLRQGARPYEIEASTTAYLAAFGLPPTWPG